MVSIFYVKRNVPLKIYCFYLKGKNRQKETGNRDLPLTGSLFPNASNSKSWLGQAKTRSVELQLGLPSKRQRRTPVPEPLCALPASWSWGRT